MRTIEEIADEIMSYPNYESVPKDLRKEYQELRFIQVQEEESDIYNRYESSKDIPLDRLKEICTAEKEGRLVVLPVNVGDVVYVNFSISGSYFRKNEKPYACKVVFIGINEKGGFISIKFKNGRMWCVDFEDIGKTVFLAKEEALKALGGAE